MEHKLIFGFYGNSKIANFSELCPNLWLPKSEDRGNLCRVKFFSNLGGQPKLAKHLKMGTGFKKIQTWELLSVQPQVTSETDLRKLWRVKIMAASEEGEERAGKQVHLAVKKRWAGLLVLLPGKSEGGFTEK